ncbi:MAG TPA: flagellar biosynthetic protein FliR [Cyclobacteriaceae bacterium]|nr:flagellar biosynthetic protein FliR [Cyclobacteriaceae bacterium]
MTLSETEIALFIQQYFLPFCRIGAMFMAMPVLGARLLSPRVRLILALLVSVLVVPLLPPLQHTPALSLATVLVVLQEIALGLCVGFVFQVVFQVFVLTGQIIAMKMGLGFASMNDPTNGVQTTALSQFFLMLTTLMFIAINGHLVLISMLVDSFHSLPPGSSVLSRDLFMAVANLGSWLFISGLLLALPVVTALLFVNIAFGVMSRAAPQLNIFAVGFPFTLITGLALVWVGLGNFTEDFERVMDYGFLFVHDLLAL